jgi:hypothetical protein
MAGPSRQANGEIEAGAGLIHAVCQPEVQSEPQSGVPRLDFARLHGRRVQPGRPSRRIELKRHPVIPPGTLVRLHNDRLAVPAFNDAIGNGTRPPHGGHRKNVSGETSAAVHQPEWSNFNAAVSGTNGASVGVAFFQVEMPVAPQNGHIARDLRLPRARRCSGTR